LFSFVNENKVTVFNLITVISTLYQINSQYLTINLHNYCKVPIYCK